jgi:uncharacterized protein
MARACVVAQSGGAMLATAPMQAHYVHRYGISKSYTKAIALGDAVINARKTQEDPIAAVCTLEADRHIFNGKMTDLRRHLRGFFSVGDLKLAGFDDFSGQTAGVAIQSEFLILRRSGQVEVRVPDLIVLLDVANGSDHYRDAALRPTRGGHSHFLPRSAAQRPCS